MTTIGEKKKTTDAQNYKLIHKSQVPLLTKIICIYFI